jgi:hypothetical protein
MTAVGDQLLHVMATAGAQFVYCARSLYASQCDILSKLSLGADTRQIAAFTHVWAAHPHITDGADERFVIRHRFKLASNAS